MSLGNTAGKKKTTSGKVTRTEAVKEPENERNPRVGRRRAQNTEPDEPCVQTTDEGAPARKVKPASVKPNDVEPPSSRRGERGRGRQPSVVEHPSFKKTMPARKNIFSGSDSDESCDDTVLISNKNSYFDPIRKRKMTPGRIHPVGRTSLEESSSDEEVETSRRPVRPVRAAPRRKEKKDTSEEDELPVKPVSVKVKPRVNAEINTSSVRNRTLKLRKLERRYVSSGSSTEEDSICSSRSNTRNKRDQDSSSFVDDASYVR